jgi:hypothetical protein
MIIKILLISVLGVLALFAAFQRVTSQMVRIAVLIGLAIGGYFVWLPEQANEMAEALGVGRGADLLMYVWVLVTLAVILVLYLKIIETNRMNTRLARTIALMHPMRPRDCGDEP